MQKARRQPSWGASSPVGLRPLVSTRFQVLFHSPPGVLFTFPSRYWFTIGRWRVFSLARWSSRIPTGFHVSRGTWVPDPKSRIVFAYGALTLYGRTFQNLRLTIRFLTLRLPCEGVRSAPATPTVQRSHA